MSEVLGILRDELRELRREVREEMGSLADRLGRVEQALAGQAAAGDARRSLLARATPVLVSLGSLAAAVVAIATR